MPMEETLVECEKAFQHLNLARKLLQLLSLFQIFKLCYRYNVQE